MMAVRYLPPEAEEWEEEEDEEEEAEAVDLVVEDFLAGEEVAFLVTALLPVPFLLAAFLGEAESVMMGEGGGGSGEDGTTERTDEGERREEIEESERQGQMERDVGRRRGGGPVGCEDEM